MSTGIQRQFTLTAVLGTSVATLLLGGIGLFFIYGDSQSGSSYLPAIVIVAVALTLITLANLTARTVARKIALPVHQLEQQIRNIGQDLPPEDERIQPANEIGQLARAIYEMAADLELQNRSVKYLAFHDPLTGLSNRANFQMQVEDQIVETANRRQRCALMYIDLDDFKEINDTRGHEYGDRALRAISGRISSCLTKFKDYEHLGKPLLARMGGDEFTILFSGKVDESLLLPVIESVLEQASEPLEIDGDVFQLSSSIGIAFYPNDALSASELFHCADMAMYKSKSAGKGTYRFYHESMNADRDQFGQIKSQFKSALTNGEVSLVYQPVVDIHSGRMIGAEALIRWDHPERGMLLPDQFMAIVEQHEIAFSADLWVLKEVTSLIVRLDLSSKPEFQIAANISASNLARKQFTAAVANHIADDRKIASHLQLEVTETHLHKDEEQAKISLSELKDTGVSIWLDDFCTGYSSLKHLSIFPIDGIKIDRQFVHNMTENAGNRGLVNALMNMSRSFNVEVVAEGVDNIADLHQLQKMGCRYAQGYLFSRPVSEEEFVKILNEDKHLM